jgi:uncharacterized protein
VRFWDSSALIPLVCDEDQTRFCTNLIRLDQIIIVWSLSSVEIYSALCKKYRDGTMNRKEFGQAKERNTTLWQSYTEITEYSLVKKRSYRLLETHRLRAADALHLAAALVAFEEQTSGVEFVTFDRNLGDAAEKEGFIVTGLEQLKD